MNDSFTMTEYLNVNNFVFEYEIFFLFMILKMVIASNCRCRCRSVVKFYDSFSLFIHFMVIIVAVLRFLSIQYIQL